MAEGSFEKKPRPILRPIFFLLLGLHALAVFLFTRGFLLTRTELSSYSHCHDLPSPNPSPSPPPPPPPPPTPRTPRDRDRDRDRDPPPPPRCWTRPAIDRLVVIVFDALRFDFVAPSTFFEEKKPWMDKLRVLHKLASDEGSSARIFKAIADPPTTSLQRLKGLTTGGLPTFIDVGNSFGAPAIIEDNLIHQLVKNGKRVLMMGDDTWMQLFPEHFEESHPYPSFNVKDLDTVDNGILEHLLPSLYKDDWDVLIAHFLGVDHAGHIFGVDSTPMIKKLEQYNSILESVVDVLKNLSRPGGLHENTYLIVMGDHGQTLNGDHGGGTAEEVETSLFAWSMRSPPSSISSVLEENMCKLNLDGEKLCVGTMQQLDFAVTMAALLGVPFPFGSIGRVNPELYALSAGTWDRQRTDAENCKLQSDLEAWMQNYANVLCINCWQVKRYIDLYSATSIIGFSADDLHFVTDLYERALANCSSNTKASCLFGTGVPKEIQDYSVSVLQSQIDAYSHFLESVAKLARSAWTEFDLLLMGIGLGILLLSIIIHILAATWVHILFQSYLKEQGIPGLSYRYFLAFLLVAIRAASFLSNSYILAEGRVANFLLGTTGIMNLWRSVEKGDLKKDEFAFLLLNVIIRFGIGFGLSKQTGGSSYLVSDSLKFVGINEGHLRWLVLEIFPIVFLSLLFVFLLKCIAHVDMSRYMKYFTIMGTVLSYVLIATHWASESILIFISPAFQGIGRNLAPRLVYAIGFGILGLSVLSRILDMKERMTVSERLTNSTVPMLSAWSPTILILLGKQGPFVAFVCIAGAWCIISSSKKFLSGTKSGTLGGLAVDPISVTQWSLLAVCLFYLTGHWCTFDGLRYGAAFIGFDHFNIIRQGILLSIDTFGVSHILPILGLPFIVALQYHDSKKGELKDAILLNLSQVFLIYGLITAITTTFTVLCATIQRRHLMVWGLFAPKYVFDAIGLLVTDALICLAVLYYY
ncbi:GPI ethanolamine phosphate transferase 3 isoform X3 [Ananas comosus]|uniref:GPI ethanolamine phosphate transferase 3 isoform X3 n=1 Tax=Ananas comosus TaxID=4615 RepID=A0A6P5G153_ANACO|nr:GPI ethanolamine phosphate transferase 3 isoform X3 [Ananas comosus]